MNSWKKAAVVTGVLAITDLLGANVAVIIALVVAKSEYMTPLEDRLMSAAGVLMLTLMALTMALFVVGALRDGAVKRKQR